MAERVSVGLDISHLHINMVKLGFEPEGTRLLDSANLNFTPGQAIEEKAEQLKKLFVEKNITNVDVNVGLSGDSVVVRYIILPKMTRDEVVQALKYEAQQYIPFKIEDVFFDFCILDDALKNNKIKIMLVAAKKKAITELIEFLKLSALKPGIIDLNSIALINCFYFNGPKFKEDDVYALVNLDYDIMSINILQGKMPSFTRDIPVIEEIKTLGREYGIEKKVLLEKIMPLLPTVVHEIQISLDYYESEFSKLVGKIFFSGEGTSIPEIMSFFTEQIDKEAIVWNPLQNLIIDSTIDGDLLKSKSYKLALACGLSLRE